MDDTQVNGLRLVYTDILHWYILTGTLFGNVYNVHPIDARHHRSALPF